MNFTNSLRQGVKNYGNINKAVALILLSCIIIMMFTSWFGGFRGVQEIKGTIVLSNPATIFAILAIIVSLFIKKDKFSNIIRICGFGSIVVMEAFYFLTWYLETVNQTFSFSKSINMAYPEFYIGFIISCVALILSIFGVLKKSR